MEGINVLIQQLFGGWDKTSAESFNQGLNKVITALTLDNNSYDCNDDNEYHNNGGLHFTFEDGYKMRLYDAGQSCCEKRYMHTDDDLSYYVGATLTGAEIVKGPADPDRNDDDDDLPDDRHEIQFLKVDTNRGRFTVETHNEHNGYYGGFSVVAEEEK
jgi:hypothetical protein